MHVFRFLLTVLLLTIVGHGLAADRSFTLLHTNDWQSRLLGFGPNNEYTPGTTDDDATVGGVARLATLLKQRRAAADERPVLLLDGGDFSMGTLFHTVTRELGSELRLLSALGYDATTLGNHEFDFRPDGLAKMIDAAARAEGAGLVPILSSNIRFSAQQADDDRLQMHQDEGRILPYRVVEKGGLRFGLFGLMGYDAVEVSPLMTPVTFADPIDVAAEMVRTLRDKEQVDVVILLSHMGVSQQPDGSWRGEDIELVERVPGIDIVVGAHSHSVLTQPVLVNGRTLVLQAGSEIQYLGELHMRLDEAGVPRLVNYQLHPIDDALPGDEAISAQVADYQGQVSARVLQPLGYRFDQPLAKVDKTLTRAWDDPVLGNLVTDALRQATRSDIAFTGNGTIRDDLFVGRTGVQNVSDLFRIAPLGIGEFDDEPGYPLIKVYFTPREIKNILEVLLLAYQLRESDSYYPRVSGIRFSYNPYRVPFDRVSRIWLGSAEQGYQELDMARPGLLSVGATSYVGSFTWLISELSKGLLEVVPKDADGQPLAMIRDAVFDREPQKEGIQEYKEWQALLDYISRLPDLDGDGLADISSNGAAAEQRLLRVASLAPTELFKYAGLLQWGAAALVGFLMVLMVWLGFRLRRRRVST